MVKMSDYIFYLVNKSGNRWEIQNEKGDTLSDIRPFDSEQKACEWAMAWASSWRTAEIRVKAKLDEVAGV